MSKLNLIKEIERLRINEDEYDDYESNKMSQEVAVAKMFTRLAKQGRDPIDMISHRFGWSTHELDDLAQQHGFKNAAEWMNSFKRGVAEDNEQKYRVTYDMYSSNREKPLYTKTRTVRADSEEEAIKIIQDLIGGRNHRIEKGVAEGLENLSYIGNCTDDDVIEHIFGDATNFAQAVEEHGDEFTVNDLVVKYDPDSDIHSFYYKKQGVAEGKFTVNAKTGAKLHPRTGAELPPKEKPLTMKDMFRQPKSNAPKLTIDEVWRKVEDVVSRIFPDGDPIDYLAPWLERHGIRDFKIGEILDRAAKKNGYKDLYDYYNSMKDLYGPEKGVTEGYKEPTDAAGHAKMAAKIKKMLDDTLADSGDRRGNLDLQRLVRAYEYHIEKAKEKSKGVAEGRFDEPLTGWHIVHRNTGNPVHATPSFETKEQAQKYLMTKMFANHQNYKVVHTANVGVAEGSERKDMTGQTCEKCKKDKYKERSQHDDMEGKVTCSCGHRVNRWKNYKEQGVAKGLNEAKTKTGPDISDYHVTASWKDRGTSHKRWDKDHMQGSPVDRHQSSIQLWQHEGKKPEYHAHHRIESGYWTDQTLEGPPTVVTHKSVHPSLDAAVDALEKHTNEFYKNKKAMKEHQGVAKGLNEAKTKTKTKPDISDTFKQKPDQPLTKKDDKKAEKPKDEPKGKTPKFKVSSKDETLKKTAGIRMNDRAAELSSKMKDVEADPDDPGYPKHETLPSTNVKPDNVPAVINKAMTVKGFLNPEWHIVANLPGNMATAIRTVGRKLFKSFTRTPTDKIVMIGNVMNHGPNTNAEINAVAKWLKNAGQEVSSGDIDFSDFMPGYKADIKLYDAAGCRFLLVEDFAGRYVYVWPHNDSVTMSNAPQLTKEDINIIKEAELRFRTLAGL